MAVINVGCIISVFKIYKIKKTVGIILNIKKFNLDTIINNLVSLIIILLIVIIQRYNNLLKKKKS